MGGSVGACTIRKDVNSIFIDETLVQSALALRSSAELRADFIEFVKSGTWTDGLDAFEESLSILAASSESAWKRFGYKAPNVSGGSNAKSSFETNTGGSFKFSDSGTDVMSSKSNSGYAKVVLDECYTAISSSQLFKKEELRSILVAALVPMYFPAPEPPESGNSGLTSMDEDELLSVVGEEYTVRCFSPKKATSPPMPKTERLQEWLSGAAAMFDSCELDDYLASPSSCWVEDYYSALRALTTTITVSTVDPSAKESRIVYSNAANSLAGPEGHLGRNMHEIFGTDVSPGGADQIAKAVFDAKRYKRSLVDNNGMCRLRALKPVFDHRGRHIYTIGLESCLFEDPSLQDTKILAEAPFQQIEDLLLMLPLLIRGYKHSKET